MTPSYAMNVHARSAFATRKSSRSMRNNNLPAIFGCRSRTMMQSNFFSSADDGTLSASPFEKKEDMNIGIVGGGLAGLSLTYHLLLKAKSLHNINNIQITILDQAKTPGTMGASSVAGGLLHPFTPRGKLVHFGLEGLEVTNQLLHAALRHEPKCILRDCMYRAALSEKHVHQLRQTVEQFPELAQWLSARELKDACGAVYNVDALGGIRMANGCKVVHVPTYLSGLWQACRELACASSEMNVHWRQTVAGINGKNFEGREFDTVVLAAGSGIVQDDMLDNFDCNNADILPVTLVRGQSVELAMKMPHNNACSAQPQAVLCGKYVAPLDVDIDDNNKEGEVRVLIGATHEYKEEALTPDAVVDDLKGRSYDLAPSLWDGGTVERITSGWRVQSERGMLGRVPIVGRVVENNDTNRNNTACERSCTWLFTGLGSRGLIHHGIYGSILADAILSNDDDDENVMLEKYPHMDWWKR